MTTTSLKLHPILGDDQSEMLVYGERVGLSTDPAPRRNTVIICVCCITENIPLTKTQLFSDISISHVPLCSGYLCHATYVLSQSTSELHPLDGPLDWKLLTQPAQWFINVCRGLHIITVFALWIYKFLWINRDCTFFISRTSPKRSNSAIGLTTIDPALDF